MKDEITTLLSLPVLAFLGYVLAIAKEDTAGPSWGDVGFFFVGIAALALIGLAFNIFMFNKTWRSRQKKGASLTLVFSGINIVFTLIIVGWFARAFIR